MRACPLSSGAGTPRRTELQSEPELRRELGVPAPQFRQGSLGTPASDRSSNSAAFSAMPTSRRADLGRAGSPCWPVGAVPRVRRSAVGVVGEHAKLVDRVAPASVAGRAGARRCIFATLIWNASSRSVSKSIAARASFVCSSMPRIPTIHRAARAGSRGRCRGPAADSTSAGRQPLELLHRREPVAGRQHHTRNRDLGRPVVGLDLEDLLGQDRALRLVRRERIPGRSFSSSTQMTTSPRPGTSPAMKRWKTIARCSAVFVREAPEPPPAPAGLCVSLGQDSVEVLPDHHRARRLQQSPSPARWPASSRRQ